MILFGISTCDTCKKAIRQLEAAGHSVSFRDVRKDPLTEAEIETIVGEFGERVINKSSTTYRAFSEFLRASDPDQQIKSQPTVMKRPIIHSEGRWYLGWDQAVIDALIR